MMQGDGKGIAMYYICLLTMSSHLVAL
jgi:hypothetical protein